MSNDSVSSPSNDVSATEPSVAVPTSAETHDPSATGASATRVRIGSQRGPGEAPSAPSLRPRARSASSAPGSGGGMRVAVPNVRQRLSDEQELEVLAALGAQSVDALLSGPSVVATPELAPDTRLKGRVAMLHGDDVFVELGGRNQGIVSARQMPAMPDVGQVLEVIVDRFLPEEQLYSLRVPGGAVDVGDWSEIANGMVIETRVTGHNKGGLECEVNNIRGFIPAGQVSPYRVEDLSVFVGEKLKCLVTECNPERRNLVLSRRAVLELEQQEAREKTWAELEEGQVREGVVRGLMDFGAFVDLGGVDGLVHISQMSWKRIRHPSELLKIGDKVKVVVRKLDPEARKVSLTLRDLADDPWLSLSARFPVSSVVKGQVTRLMDFGAFVEIEPGVEGLVHISELSHGRVFRVRDIVKEGDFVEAKVMSLDPENRRIGLAMKAIQDKPQSGKKARETEEEEAPPPPLVLKHKGPLKGGKATDRPSDGASFGLKW